MKRFSLVFLLVVAASAGLVPPLGSVQEGIKSAEHEDLKGLALPAGLDPEDLPEAAAEVEDPAGGDGGEGASTTEILPTEESTTDDGVFTTDEDLSTELTSEDGSTSQPITHTTTSNPVTPGGQDNGLSGGEIAGIVIGTLAGVALIAGLIYYLKVKDKLCF
ncbi:uncharacterized protein [Panulirus ornatus]|uniref:uncharacterized protein n=1 Tax=Panulirus ornatus TaxID=150431 RepID=UPI003A8444B3